MNTTGIEWCDFTWNPITGCPGMKVSPGCANCYAERTINTRLRHLYSEERPSEHIHFHPERLDQPRKLKKPSRIFVGSMCDLFHDDVEVEVLEPVFWEFSKCRQHTFMLLTKRPEKMRWWFSDGLDLGALHPNVWIGVTVCNQDEADAKIPVLLDIPAAKRFVSVEPMLGPVDLTAVSYPQGHTGAAPESRLLDTLRGLTMDDAPTHPALDWVICGGETGPGARPMHPDWVRGLRDQCVASGVPFFFKGWGEWIAVNYDDYPDWQHRDAGKGIFTNLDPARGRFWDADCAYRPDENGVSRKIYGTDLMYRVGKRQAGRPLDGREWNEVPS